MTFRLYKMLLACLLGPWLVANAPPLGSGYDPLRPADTTRVRTVDLSRHDETRGRDIPLRVYLPEGRRACPVVLFSHGLGGTRMGSAFMGRHWAARGYVAVFLQHPGSDESVWRNARPLDRMPTMRRAANAKNFSLRVGDVRSVLDAMERWGNEKGHALEGRLDLSRVGMSGHSFGAVTTQAVSGQAFAGRPLFTDERVRAAIPMSPSSPRSGDARAAFGPVAIPWLLMTGTDDVSSIGDQAVEDRLRVFPALPKGSKYEVVLDGAEHSVFTESSLPGDRRARNPDHHRAILALSTAFWDAYLRMDPEARAWLDGDGPATVLRSGDRWQKK